MSTQVLSPSEHYKALAEKTASAERAKQTSIAPRSAAVVLNSLVVFQAGLKEENKNQVLRGLLKLATDAATADEIYGWEHNLEAAGGEASWIAGHFRTEEAISIPTQPGDPIRKAVEKYLFEHLSPKQANDVRATLEALPLATNLLPRQVFNYAAVRAKESKGGAVSSASFIISILSPTLSERIRLAAWRFSYELKHKQVLAGQEDTVHGLKVVPLELELDPAQYKDIELKDDLLQLVKQVTVPPSTGHAGQTSQEELDALEKWAASNITDEGHVILLSAPVGGRYPFDATFFGILSISGYADITTLYLEVNTAIKIPILGKVSLGSIKGDLKTGIVLDVNVKVASGSLRFFLEGSDLKVSIALNSPFGNWNTTAKILTLPI